MAFRVPVLDSIGPGTRISLALEDALEVGPGIQLITTDSAPAVDAIGGVNDIVVAGRVSSAGIGIRTAQNALEPSLVEVETGGLVSGNLALQAGAGIEVTNNGAMLGTTAAIQLNLDTTAGQRIVNNGRLVGGVDGINLTNDGAQIIAARARAASIAEGTVIIENHGTIRGGETALDLVFLTGLVRFHIFNTGSIRGDINLGAGRDDLINQGSIRGVVDMGAGNDVFTTSGRAETVQGGSGTDTIFYTGQGFVTLTLESATGNLGGATGSQIRGFENVMGSSTGFDSLTGNSVNNELSGRGGDDTLRGLSGNDTLFGGADNDRLDGGVGIDQLFGDVGNDVFVVDSSADLVRELANQGTDLIETSVSLTLAANVENGVVTSPTGRALTGNVLVNRLTGGSGADTLNGGIGVDILTGAAGVDHFRFTAKTEAGDQITDFTSGTDKISIDISAFAVALPTGVLAASRLRIRADNVAQDGDDNFIFRTTDKTLWLDANGNLGGGLTLIADMQASATISANDFAIF